MSAIALPLHHLVSCPQRPQPCCHSVLWGFCFLSSSLLRPQSLFCFFYHHNGSCRGTACPARLSTASGLASLLLRSDPEESRRVAVATSSFPQFLTNRLQKEGPFFHLLQLPLLAAMLSEAKVGKVIRCSPPHSIYWESILQVHIQEPLQPAAHTLCLGFYD